MDDSFNDTAGIRCPRGQIARKAHHKTLRSGKGVYVASKCIKDRGAPGRWQSVKHMMGIGPLKKGSLSIVGYHANDSTEKRHVALEKAVHHYGKSSTVKKLNAVAIYTKRTTPSRSRTYRRDRNWVSKKF
jgi:hypothetical protein